MTNKNLCSAPQPAPSKSQEKTAKFYERFWQYLLQIPCMQGQSWQVQTSKSWMTLSHPRHGNSICINVAFSGASVGAKALKVEVYVRSNNDPLWNQFCNWLNTNPNHLSSLYTKPKNNQHTNRNGTSERIRTNKPRPIGTYAVRPSPTPNSPEPILFNPNQIPTGAYFGHLNEIRLALENAVGFVHAGTDRRVVTWNKDTFDLTNSDDMHKAAEWFCETAQVFYAVMKQF